MQKAAGRVDVPKPRKRANWVCPRCGQDNSPFVPDCLCGPPLEGPPPALLDGEIVRKSEVLRELGGRFPRMRPRIELDRDAFGRPLDWHWPGKRGWAYGFDADRMGVAVYSRQVAGPSEERIVSGSHRTATSRRSS